MKNFLMSLNEQKKYLIILLILLSLKFTEILNVYCINGDGPWSLSQILSMINGDWGWSKFAHEPDGQIYKNYTYAILYYVPFKIFGASHLTYLLSYFSYIVITVYGVYKIFSGNTFLQFFISLLFVSSVYTYNFRYEVVAIMLIVWGLYFYFKKDIWIYLSMLLFAWAALIHPATFVALFFVILHFLYFEKKLFDVKTIILYLILFTLFCFLLIGFDIHNLLNPIFIRPELKERFLVLRPENIFKWLILAGVFVWSFVIIARKISWVSLILILANIFVYFLFKKSYYYPYLILHVIVLFYYNKDQVRVGKLIKNLIYIHLILFTGLFFVFPFYKFIENPEYGDLMRKSETFLKQIPDDGSKIYVEKELIMGVQNKKNARLYLKEYSNYFNGSPKINLKDNDRIYIFRKKEIVDFKNLMTTIIYQKDVEIKQIYKPVKGLLTFNGRADSIGLWEIRLKQ